MFCIKIWLSHGSQIVFVSASEGKYHGMHGVVMLSSVAVAFLANRSEHSRTQFDLE